MNYNPYQNYKEQTVSTMTQGELLQLLFDELVKRLMRCKLAITKGDDALLETSANRSLEIIRYLDGTLDYHYPISERLHHLYDFFGYELNRVKAGRNAVELDEILPMITELRDSFREADKNCAKEAGGANAAERS